MSAENVEVVRRAIDAFNRRDLDAAGRDFDPEAVVDWSRSAGVEAGVYCGSQAIRGFYNTFLEMFDRYVVEPEEFIDFGEHVVVANRTRLWGRDGIEVEAHSVEVVVLRHGHIVQWLLYRDRDEAVKAVGLED